MTERLKEYRQQLIEEEKSAATVEKYLRDIRAFLSFLATRQGNPAAPADAVDAIDLVDEVDKEVTVAYKEYLTARYAPASVNSMVIAVNRFLRYIGKAHCCVKPLKIQRQIFCPEEKELTRAEYVRLVDAARRKNNERLSLLLETIGGTGIRVSELQFITAAAVRRGEAAVYCKGKLRTVFLPPRLQKKLLRYIKARAVTGAVFVTRSGKPIDRSNIWREMKALCAIAGVAPGKVFPHNLRHLFARTFYGLDRDIVRLADILGHSSIDTTRIYVVSSGTEHRRKIERMRLIL